MNSLAPQSVTEAKQLRKSVNLSQDPKAADALNSALSASKDGAVSVTLPSVGAEVEQPLPQSTDAALPNADQTVPSDAAPSSPPVDEFKFGETDIASQPPLQYDVKETDEETEEKFLYKKGVLLYSCSAHDRADIITAMKIDGDIAFFGTHGGKVIGWDLKQNAQVCSVDIKPPESSEPEDLDDPLKDRDTPEAKNNDDDEKREDGTDDGEADKRETNVAQNAGGRLLSVSCIEVNSGSLLVGSSTGQVGVWSQQTGVCAQIWHDHSERVTAIKLMENSAYTVSHDGYMLVRDTEQNKILHSFVNCTCPISCMVIQEPHLLLVGSWDGAIRQLDLKAQKVTMELRHPDHSPVRAMTLHPESQLLICSHGSGNITSWDLRAESVFIENYTGHSAVVNALIVHNNRLYSASDDKTVRVWDLAKGLCLDALSGHDDGVSSMEVSEDTLLTASYDGTVRAYKLSSIEAAVDLRKRRLEEGRRISQELWLKHKEEARARKQKKGKEKKSAKPTKK